MYGLVNRGIKEFVVSQLGTAGWAAIRRSAEIPVDEFVDLEPYPDAWTYALVGAASEQTGTPADELLRAFGRFWILFTAESAYADLLEGAPTLGDFLASLDDLHQSVADSMPALKPPSFGLDEVAGGWVLTYVSERDGLEPMVEGLLDGLLETFGLEGRATRIQDSPYGEVRFRVDIDV